MLIRITIGNFKSYDEREEFYMIPSDDEEEAWDLTSHFASAGGYRLLKYASVFGANASGKSNLVAAFSFITSMLKSAKPEMHKWRDAYCRNKEDNAEKDSFFEIQFTVGEKMYGYGFTAILSHEKITAEWMDELFPDGKAESLFGWKDGNAPGLGKDVLSFMSGSDVNRFEIYSNDFNASKKTSGLFLAEMNAGKSYDSASGLFFFKQTYDWLTRNVIVITPSIGITSNEFLCKESYMEKLNALMESFDTGITGIGVKDISRRDMGDIPAQEIDGILDRVSSAPGQYVWRRGTDVFIIRVSADGKLDFGTLLLKHRGTDSDFYMSDESDGTRRLFDLMDILITDRPDAVYVIDELERSLHPNLTEHFFRTFTKNNAGGNTQLILATHERTLMRREFFRRDEIWFVDKDIENASKLYSLDYYKKTCDDRLAEAYLEGRFGAVPILDRE